MLSLLVATALGTSPHSPHSRYIVVSSNRDHAQCKGQQPFPWTIYVTAKPDVCALWVQLEPPSDGESKNESNALSGFFGYKFHVSSSGIQVTTYTDASCSNVHHVFDPSPFGECVEGLGITMDVVDNLPKPTPGMVLEKRCWNSRSCGCEAPTYVLYQTSCVAANEDTATPYDVEVDCEDGVHGYSSFRYKGYASHDGSCTKLGGATEVFNNWECTTLAPRGGTPFSSEAVWCGAECSAWKSLRTRFQYCDSPRSHSPHAVDLNQEVGQKCSNTTHPPGAGSCCYSPLGYAGGSKVGTPCGAVCLYYGRYGSDAEYCVSSQRPNDYGNCFCGPKIFAPPSVASS